MGKRKHKLAEGPKSPSSSCKQTEEPLKISTGTGFPFAPSFIKRQISRQSLEEEARDESSSTPRPPRAKRRKTKDSHKTGAESKYGPATAAATPASSCTETTGYQEPVISVMKSFIGCTDDNLGLICVRPNSTLYLSGSCSVTALRGSISINGFKLKLLKKICSVFAPVWGPAHRVHFSESSTKRNNWPVASLLQHVNIKDTDFKISDVQMNVLPDDCLLLVEGRDINRMEWMLAAEDYSKYKDSREHDNESLNRLHLNSVLVGDLACMRDKEIDTLVVPKNWVSCAGDMTLDDTRSKVMIVGAKGVGKSTCLRYLINRYLSKYPEVCVIDCDVGQPEFTMPGQLSLHVIREPVLAAAHLNMKLSESSFFVGDITNKNDPSLIFAVVEKLYRQYELLLAERRRLKGSSSENGYDALASDDRPALPLLINTDGFIRYLGSEIMGGIIRIVSPDHIVQLLSAKDTAIAAVEDYLQDSESRGALVTKHCIDAGRASASRIAPVDLRTLRIVSYFLRWSPHVTGMYPLDGDSSLVSPGVYVKSGGLVDPSSMIAKALLRAPVTSHRTELTPLRILSGEKVVDSMLPTLFNVSLVGLIPLDEIAAVCVHGAPRYRLINMQLRLPANETHKFELKSFQVCPECSSTNSHCIEPCHSLGIVRAVDTAEGYYHISRAVAQPCLDGGVHRDEQATGGDCPIGASPAGFCLYRGSMQLPLIMTHITDFPFHPYVSGDSVGEGSGSAKGRNNVKRRSHT